MSHPPSKVVPIHFFQRLFHVFVFTLFSSLQTAFSLAPLRGLKEAASRRMNCSISH